MRFKVERTSLWDDEVSPCEGAQQGTIPSWDKRTFKTPAEYDAKFGERHGPWHSEGTEHKTTSYGIARRREDRIAWFVELADLDALVAFQQQHGELVFKWADEDDDTPTLEIYDGYRE